MDRRTFLGGLAASALFPHVLSAQNKEDKACILVYLSGGIAAPEWINPIPEAPEKYRSTTGFQKGKNFLLGGNFEKLAGHTDKLSLVHSYGHIDNNHGSAAAATLSGHLQPQLLEGAKMLEPYVGCLICNHVGPRNSIGIPSLVKVDKIDFGARRDDRAWLDVASIGFDADQEGINNLKFGIPQNRIDDRMRIVEFIDKKDSILDQNWTSLRREAYNIAVGQAASAFDLSKESRENQLRFNIEKSNFGKSALMALRLIRSGSKFAQIVNGSWDYHNDIKKSFDQKAPELDTILSILLEELLKENLLEKTLVVVCTEFGRTPLNITQGRDHNSRCIPLVFAGGNYTHGRIIGQAEKDGLSVKSNPYSPEDVLWTICDHFGVPKHKTITDSDGRPHHLFKDDAKNILV